MTDTQIKMFSVGDLVKSGVEVVYRITKIQEGGCCVYAVASNNDLAPYVYPFHLFTLVRAVTLKDRLTAKLLEGEKHVH